MPGNGTVVVLAGRRIDAADSTQRRFPLDNVPLVTGQLRQLFAELDADALICSAANGADLIALGIAQERGMRCRIVLPCSVHDFRQASVGDRPGDQWVPLFDELTAMARSRGDLIIVDPERSSNHPAPSYAAAAPGIAEPSAAARLHVAANARIIEEALQMAGDNLVGVAVWDRRSRGEDDITAAFVERLAEHHIPVRHISTLTT